MAAALGKPVSTVQSWKVRGSIPDANKPDVLAKARELRLDLGREDFFPVDFSPKDETQFPVPAARGAA